MNQFPLCQEEFLRQRTGLETEYIEISQLEKNTFRGAKFTCGKHLFPSFNPFPIFPENVSEKVWGITEERAVECLALFASLSADITKKYFSLFVLLAKNEDPQIRFRFGILDIFYTDKLHNRRLSLLK